VFVLPLHWFAILFYKFKIVRNLFCNQILKQYKFQSNHFIFRSYLECIIWTLFFSFADKDKPVFWVHSF